MCISLLTIRIEKETHFQKLHVEICAMQPQLKNVIYITVLPFEYRCIRVVIVVIVVVVVVVIVAIVVVGVVVLVVVVFFFFFFFHQSPGHMPQMHRSL